MGLRVFDIKKERYDVGHEVFIAIPGRNDRGPAPKPSCGRCAAGPRPTLEQRGHPCDHAPEEVWASDAEVVVLGKEEKKLGLREGEMSSALR
eukprot:14769985-Heterocapsa_arctica.AAC.1